MSSAWEGIAECWREWQVDEIRGRGELVREPSRTFRHNAIQFRIARHLPDYVRSLNGRRGISMNQMKCSAPLDHSVGNQTVVKTGQLTIVRASKRQKVRVGDVSRIQETRRVHIFAVE